MLRALRVVVPCFLFACSSKPATAPLEPEKPQEGAMSSDAGSMAAPGTDGGAPTATAKLRIITGPGPDPTSGPHLRFFNRAGESTGEIANAFPNDPGLTYGSNVAACDVDGDGRDEVVVGAGAGPGNGARVRVLNADGTPAVADLYPVFDGDARFGVEVACGDLDGDGRAEIVVAPGPQPTALTTIRVFSPQGARLREFQAFPAEVKYGARVAVGDLDGDKRAEIIVAPGPAPVSTAHVKIFSADGTPRSDFHAFDDTVLFGGRLAAGDLDGDGKAEIVVSPGPAALSPAHVKVFRADGTSIREFRAPEIQPHLTGLGYFHVHDPAFGLHIPEVADFTNLAHLWDPSYVATAKAHGMRAMLDLESYVGSQPETSWAANLQAAKARVGADLSSLEAVYVIDEPNCRGWDTAKQARAVELVKATFPGVPTVITYCQGGPRNPPSNVDWIAVDPYLWNVDTQGCAARPVFDAAMEWLTWAKGTGKPIVLIAPSFRRTVPGPVPMPSLCQQSWYFEAALAEPNVRALIWFMYGHAKAAERGEEIFGVREHPEVLAYHRRVSENLKYGAYGANLAVGDVDGDGRAEIIVGRGEGPGNGTGFQIFRADGTAMTDAVVPYPGARFGVTLAVGRF